MPTPLPSPEQTNLDPPDAEEVRLLTCGVLSAIEPPDGHSDFQLLLVHATFAAMTGHRTDPASIRPMTPDELAVGLERRNAQFRNRILQTMILGALVLRPLPESVAEQVATFARAMSVDDGMLTVARNFAQGQLALAAVDFDRNGYTSDWSAERAATLNATGLSDAWGTSSDDPALAARWAALEHLPAATLGRRMWEFYRARGFEFPGRPGSAPPLLAQHDWVHVLADYGTTVEAELEAFAFIARANDDPRGFSLLAMVVSLFETGYLATGAGLFEAFPGQMSKEGMAERVADALRRGALTRGPAGSSDIDFMGLDWFEVADRPIADLRDELHVTAKSEAAVAAGSVGPWEPGGISEFQDSAGRAAARAGGYAYLGFGATP